MLQKEKGSRQTRGKSTYETLVEVEEGRWLNSWPGTLQEEVEDQMDTVETYEMMNRKHKDDGVKELIA